MNEEEVKETLKTMKENIDKKYLKTRNSVAIETVLNLLEKKDKEIEELKYLENKTYQDYAILTQKIKDKIEELNERADEDNLDDFIRIQVLEELLTPLKNVQEHSKVVKKM